MLRNPEAIFKKCEGIFRNQLEEIGAIYVYEGVHANGFGCGSPLPNKKQPRENLLKIYKSPLFVGINVQFRGVLIYE